MKLNVPIVGYKKNHAIQIKSDVLKTANSVPKLSMYSSARVRYTF